MRGRCGEAVIIDDPVRGHSSVEVRLATADWFRTAWLARVLDRGPQRLTFNPLYLLAMADLGLLQAAAARDFRAKSRSWFRSREIRKRFRVSAVNRY